MKKLLLSTMLLISAPAIANSDRDRFCAELTVRYTIFHSLALQYTSKKDYENLMYKSLLNGNADESTKKLLLKLIDLAWINKEQDMNDSSMNLYRACTSGQDT
jgi:hypothetical protein